MSKEFCQLDIEKTKEQLLQEIIVLRQQIAELQASQFQPQQRLPRGGQRLNLVLQTSDIGIWFCDLPSMQLEWDAKCKEHFGLPLRTPVTVKQFLKQIHPDDRKSMLRAIQRAVREHVVCDVICRLNPANRQPRWIRAIGSVFYDETGQPSRFDGITVNVTNQKLQEEERDSLLYREQLARETAEAANRVKDEFLGVLSHELRSPLNPILGWSRLLQKRKFDPEIAQRALQTIERNAKLQTQLIEDLLDISRILRGKLTLNTCTVDLVEITEAALQTVHLAAEAKSIKIHTCFDPNLGKVAGDPVRLQQIIWNLLSNAIKFTAAEGWVEIKLERMGTAGKGQRTAGSRQAGGAHQTVFSEESGVSQADGLWSAAAPLPADVLLPAALYPLPADCAQLTIRDTGRGISADFLPYVFDYFRQANSSTTRRFGGLGLGLAIVRHLVELHGGTIQVFSPGEGQGATFTVFLPLLKDKLVKDKLVKDKLAGHEAAGRGQDNLIDLSSLHAAAVSSYSSQPLQGVCVLVVDRQHDAREVAAFTLRQFGAETLVARSTHEALRAVASHRLDVLLIDLWTPETDGYRLMQQIRTLPPEQGGQIPAIVLTSYSGEYNEQRALEAGFQLHLSKAVEPETLVAAIARLVEPSSLR